MSKSMFGSVGSGDSGGLVKICGLRDVDTIAAACAAGADYIGFIFVANSKRFISPEAVASLLQECTPSTAVVAVVADPSDDWLDTIVAQVNPHAVQFHGDESPQRLADWRRRESERAQRRGEQVREIWKAIPIAQAADVQAAQAFGAIATRLLYDTAPLPSADTNMAGGSGRCFDWSVLAGFSHPCAWGLAGGLSADNVAAAIEQTGTSLVDVSSGVEYAPACKDSEKIARFVSTARRAFATYGIDSGAGDGDRP